MYVNAVMSYLNAWNRLNRDHAHHLEEIIDSLRHVRIEELQQKLRDDERAGRVRQISPRRSISGRDLDQAIKRHMVGKGWKENVYLPHPRIQKRLGAVDFIKNAVGVEISVGKRAFVESTLFVQFPAFIKKGTFKIAVLLVPMRALTREIGAGFLSFENLRELLMEIRPMPVQYPFVIMGVSVNDTELETFELTNELDNYLLEQVGLSLEQMALLNEGPDYDFKELLPSNKKLAQEICAFANADNGGMILLGIDDDGKPVGLPSDVSIDDLQLQITNVTNDSCRPVPRFDMNVFASSLNSTSRILIVRIHELGRKPCMVNDRVYVRSGPSVRAADSEEIRRLVLSSAV